MLRRAFNDALFVLAWLLLSGMAALVAAAKYEADEARRDAEQCAARPAPQCKEARP